MMRPAVPVHVKEDVETPSLLAEFRMGPTFWSRVSPLRSRIGSPSGQPSDHRGVLDGDDSFVLVGHCGPVDDRLLMGIDLFLLGLILCLVALPLEAACWWRWRLSRMDADTALTLARALSSFRDYVSGS